MHCENCRQLIPSYLDDRLSEAERQAFRAHLRACAGCRGLAAGHDPTLLLAALPPAPAGAAEQARAEACARTVGAMIRQQRLAADLGGRRVARSWLAAAAAVLVALAGVSAWRLGWVSGAATSAPMVAEAVAEVAPPQIKVEMGGDGVRVYHQMTGGDGSNTAVCFVVNPAMEL